ncbi:MAG: hypothetical protein IJW00_11450 [Clostridia bacterium]|nr:hypothetical protein [Clostridia bacterium]MBQ9781543.1 hypothetical protein [Clostridia bacterium]
MSKNNKKKQKKKREKITWIDDGSTVADMSGVGRGLGGNRQGKPKPTTKKGKPMNRFQECAATYFGAMKMMFIPMLVVLGIICLVFLVLWILMGGLSPAMMV